MSNSKQGTLAQNMHDVLALLARGKRQERATAPDLNDNEVDVLSFLEQMGPATVGTIKKFLGVMPAQTTRVLDSLENRSDGSLIVRSINPENRRSFVVSLTDEGLRRLREEIERDAQRIENLLAGAQSTPEQIQLLETVVSRFRNQLIKTVMQKKPGALDRN